MSPSTEDLFKNLTPEEKAKVKRVIERTEQYVLEGRRHTTTLENISRPTTMEVEMQNQITQAELQVSREFITRTADRLQQNMTRFMVRNMMRASAPAHGSLPISTDVLQAAQQKNMEMQAKSAAAIEQLGQGGLGSITDPESRRYAIDYMVRQVDANCQGPYKGDPLEEVPIPLDCNPHIEAVRALLGRDFQTMFDRDSRLDSIDSLVRAVLDMPKNSDLTEIIAEDPEAHEDLRKHAACAELCCFEMSQNEEDYRILINEFGPMLKSRRGRKNNNEELFRILKAYFAKAIEAQDAEDKKKAVEARTEGCEAGPSTSKASTEDKPEEEKHGSVGCDKNDAKRKTDEKMEDEEMMDEAAPAKKNKSED